MGSALVPIILILVVGVAIFFIVYSLFAQNEEAKALQWASGSSPVKSKSGLIEVSRTLVHQFTIQYALRVKSPSYRKRTARVILTSGLGAELNDDEFIGMQFLWGVLFPIALLILNFALKLGFNPLIFIGLAPVGYQLPRFHASAMRSRRVISVLSDLPFFIDLLALSTEAGLDFQGAIQRIVEKSRGSVLSDELGNVLRDIALGSSRAQALRGLSERLDIGEVTSFVNVLIDADSTGASIVKVLKDQTVQMRLERFTRAEKAGARASQLILIPLIFFILPAVFIVVFAPAILQFMYGK
jgi:tight adherence protein C